MKKELVAKLRQDLEAIINYQEGVEFWYARDLQNLLGYTEWRNFLLVIDKAKQACANSKQRKEDHFVDVNKMISIGKGGERKIEDIQLTRYACYLIAQNGDPRKAEIAFAQTYFAVQTRKQEIIEQRIAEIERINARRKLSNSENKFAGILFERGIKDGFGRIRSKGDQALFGGSNTQQMKTKLGVPENRALADFLPTITVKAKDFATEITNFNTIREDLRSEEAITQEHVNNNSSVRSLLKKRNIYPENLPPAEDIKKIEQKVKSENKKLPNLTAKLKNE